MGMTFMMPSWETLVLRPWARVVRWHAGKPCIVLTGHGHPQMLFIVAFYSISYGGVFTKQVRLCQKITLNPDWLTLSPS